MLARWVGEWLGKKMDGRLVGEMAELRRWQVVNKDERGWCRERVGQAACWLGNTR